MGNEQAYLWKNLPGKQNETNQVALKMPPRFTSDMNFGDPYFLLIFENVQRPRIIFCMMYATTNFLYLWNELVLFQNSPWND